MAEHRTLILFRHAKAAAPDAASDGGSDLRRPLAPRGLADAKAAGRRLIEEGPLSLAICSPALRVAQTWQIASAELHPPPATQVEDRLYATSTSDLLELIQELPPEASRVVLVGHNPDLSVLATVLSGEELSMRTASLAILEVPGEWSAVGPGAATLTQFVTPRAP
jgi:phosphohistidine phosphatase